MLQNKTYHTYFGKLDFLISETLRENEISIIDMDKVSRECVFKECPNGDKVLFHLDTPLLLLKPVKVGQKTDNDKVVLEITQEYHKIEKKHS